MKIYAFIAARANSSRLPNKMLLPIRGKRVIEHVIERTKLIRGLDGIVLCTSVNDEDRILEDIAHKHEILCYRGSAEDKLARFLGAAEKFGIDYFANIDGDDPFCDFELVEQAINQVKQFPCDVIKSPDGLVCGAFTFLIGSKALKKACEIKDTTDTEMYEIYFLEPGRFDVRDLVIDDTKYFVDNIRLTLDYEEDLKFFERVFEELEMNDNTRPLREILELIERKPEIAEINIARHKDYIAKREVMKKSKKIKI